MEQLLQWAVAFQVGGLTVRWYGVLISASMALAIILGCRECKRQHISEDIFLNVVLLALPAALIGARLYYVLVNWSYYGQHANEIIAIWKGGSAIQGGVFLAVLVAWLYCRSKKQDFLLWADICMLVLPLAQAIGRWGNYINQEAYGPVIQAGSFWSWVPCQIWAEGAYHHPLFLYESLLDLAIFITLWLLIRRPHRVGYIFSSYLIFYSLIRFFLEYLRQEPLMIGPFLGAQIWSIVGIVAGVAVLNLIRHRPVVDVAAVPQSSQPSPKKKKRS